MKNKLKIVFVNTNYLNYIEVKGGTKFLFHFFLFFNKTNLHCVCVCVLIAHHISKTLNWIVNCPKPNFTDNATVCFCLFHLCNSEGQNISFSSSFGFDFRTGLVYCLVVVAIVKFYYRAYDVWLSLKSFPIARILFFLLFRYIYF